MYYWITELDDYIRWAPEENLTIKEIADHLGISVQRLCQHVLYIYGYPLEERIALLKRVIKKPYQFKYTPFESWVYAGRTPETHTPIEAWLSDMPYDIVDLKSATATGFQIQYSMLESLMDTGLPGIKKDNWTTFSAYVTTGSPIGVWLYDEKLGGTSYFYGKTRSLIEEDIKYRTCLQIPEGIYAVFPVELWADTMINGSARRAYGGSLIRENICRDLQKESSDLIYDETRFCFESYNGKKELSLFVPIIYPAGYVLKRPYCLHMEL